jgi:hypothetical protein
VFLKIIVFVLFVKANAMPPFLSFLFYLILLKAKAPEIGVEPTIFRLGTCCSIQAELPGLDFLRESYNIKLVNTPERILLTKSSF